MLSCSSFALARVRLTSCCPLHLSKRRRVEPPPGDVRDDTDTLFHPLMMKRRCTCFVEASPRDDIAEGSRSPIIACKDGWDVAKHHADVAKYCRDRGASQVSGVPTVQYGDSLRVPSEIHERLFDYQRTGVKWLWELHRQGVGGILGDEMGLGKTVQIASFLAALKVDNLLRPSIIVCPATMIGQWLNELRKWFAPIRVLVMHSSGEAMHAQRWNRWQIVASTLRDGDILVTTYQGLRMSSKLILPHSWGYVILDEGHKIRNPDAAITLVCKKLRCVHRIILSGAPIQNNLKELWSLFDFVYPGRLGTLPMFEEQFATPINAAGYLKATPAQIQLAFQHAKVLKESIDPYLLRRMKKMSRRIYQIKSSRSCFAT